MSIKFLLVQISTVLFSLEKHFKTSNDINYPMAAVCEVKNFRSKHKRIISQEITFSNVYTIFEINLNRKKKILPPKEDEKNISFSNSRLKNHRVKNSWL